MHSERFIINKIDIYLGDYDQQCMVPYEKICASSFYREPHKTLKEIAKGIKCKCSQNLLECDLCVLQSIPKLQSGYEALFDRIAKATAHAKQIPLSQGLTKIKKIIKLDKRNFKNFIDDNVLPHIPISPRGVLRTEELEAISLQIARVSRSCDDDYQLEKLLSAYEIIKSCIKPNELDENQKLIILRGELLNCSEVKVDGNSTNE